MVKKLSELGCTDPPRECQQVKTLLNRSSYYGYLEIVSCLIEYFDCKCSPHKKDDMQRTPLHEASTGGHIHVVHYLIWKIGCDPNVRDANQRTPLHEASTGGHLKVVHYLIHELKCDPNVRDAKLRTPLHEASTGGHLKVVRYLTQELKCDPVIRDAMQRTPLHYASAGGHLEVVHFFIQELECDPCVRDKKQCTPLHYAGHLNIVQYFTCELECDPFVRDENERTPLHCASWYGRLEVVHHFVHMLECDPCVRARDLNTPLHYASIGGSLEVVCYFIYELGCDPGVRNKMQNTPLDYACMYGHAEIFKCLFYKQDTIVKEIQKKTLLHHVCRISDNIDIVHFLIVEQGFDPFVEDDQHVSPFQEAVRYGNINVMKYYLQKYSIVARNYTYPRYIHCYQQVEDLSYPALLVGTKITLTRVTALHIACRYGQQAIVKHLIEVRKMNPTIDLKERLSMTPLTSACYGQHVNIIKYLINTWT